MIAHPRVYRWVTDDFSPPAAEFQPTEHPAIWYVLAMDGEELLGMWTFVPHNGVCWEAHTYLLPGHGFRRGREAARQVAAWIWENTPCHRIITNVPRFNRVALKFARDAGMAEFAVNPRSFQKNGILHDQVLLGMSRPEE